MAPLRSASTHRVGVVLPELHARVLVLDALGRGHPHTEHSFFVVLQRLRSADIGVNGLDQQALPG